MTYCVNCGALYEPGSTHICTGTIPLPYARDAELASLRSRLAAAEERVRKLEETLRNVCACCHREENDTCTVVQDERKLCPKMHMLCGVNRDIISALLAEGTAAETDAKEDEHV
jgi:hypothetical protein